MRLILQRPAPEGTPATIGDLFVDGTRLCYTLEDEDRELEANPTAKVQNQTAISRGTYKVVRHFSPHFGHDVPMLVDVPGYTLVYLHPGNGPQDTDGCVLVGYDRVSDGAIGRSVAAYKELFALVEKAWADDPDGVTLQVV